MPGTGRQFLSSEVDPWIDGATSGDGSIGSMT